MSAADNGGEPMNTVAGLETTTLVDGFLPHDLGVRRHRDARDRAAVAAPRSRSAVVRAFRNAARRLGRLNVVEGLIDHQVLGIHHVRDDLGAPIGWDLAFLALGVILIVVGFAMARSGEQLVRQEAAGSPPRTSRS